MQRSVQVVRVFTRGDAGGNLLGVIDDVAGLSTDQMQAIAAELGYSESTFVDWREGEIPEVRIFTPQVEMEFAGHPLVGTSWVLNVLGSGGVDSMRCPVGVVRTRTDGEVVWIETTLGQSVIGRTDDLAARAGMPTPLHTWSVAMPKDYTVVEYGDATTIEELAPGMDVLADETFGLLAFARSKDQVRARFFAPAGGVDEDPATGSAAVALAATLSHLGERAGSVVISQGEEVASPSTIHLQWDGANVTIGGTVASDGTRFVTT